MADACDPLPHRTTYPPTTQLLFTHLAGIEAYIFKFSTAEQSSAITAGCKPNTTTAPCGIQKVGLFWGENAYPPFAIGDSTMSAEAARLIIGATVGGNTIETVGEPTLTGE